MAHYKYSDREHNQFDYLGNRRMAISNVRIYQTYYHVERGLRDFSFIW